jgi:preprotein translocase subunit SecG
MIFLFALITVALVLVSAVLILLVLVQLPKKDAGTGVAFGGAAADALFGAGSGNVLTKITKWSAGAFFVLVLLLGMVHDRLDQGTDASAFAKKVQAQQHQTPALAPTPATPPAHPAAAAGTNAPMQLLSTPNAPVTPATPAKPN